MARRASDDEEWEDEWSPDDDDEPTISCPYCRRDIHEDSVRCPFCENYLSAEDSRPPRKSWLLIAGVALCLILVGCRIGGR
jgi:hypothetical protein